jgi:hypothetical protein
MEESSSKLRKLKREVEFELEQLRRIAKLAEALAAVPSEERRPWDAAAAAKYVSDLFLGFENLCRRRYRYMSVSEPSGPESHSEMLSDFLRQSELGASLSPELAQRFKKYLRFRHRFSHGYGYEISWEIVEEPLDLLPSTIAVLDEVWRGWLARLPDV